MLQLHSGVEVALIAFPQFGLLILALREQILLLLHPRLMALFYLEYLALNQSNLSLQPIDLVVVLGLTNG